MHLSIPFPVIPIKLTIGKEKEKELPADQRLAAGLPHSIGTYDGKDLMMLALLLIAVISVLALVAVSVKR